MTHLTRPAVLLLSAAVIATTGSAATAHDPATQAATAHAQAAQATQTATNRARCESSVPYTSGTEGYSG